MAGWNTSLAENKGRYLEELLAFLRIPSVSSLPEHAGDVARAAEWVAARLRTAGLEGVRILPTGGHPVVYGEWLHAPGRPTLLLYGHFDTQPVDPLELWDHPPFEPHVAEGRVYARGASDDKGNMLGPVLAVEALLRSQGRLPVNVKFFLEGQEEIGSPQLPEFVAAQRDQLACDLVVSADGGQYGEREPALMLAFKGLCAVQIDVTGASSDLHSGIYGGAVPNAIHALVGLLTSMRSPEGKILVEGFYDAVLPHTAAERAAIAAVPFDEATYRNQVGVEALWGEPGYTAQEQLWARPTLEVNGIWGGFQGEGIKTVLPNQSHAKVTCRLVAEQEPAVIIDLLARHVERHTPRGVRSSVRRLTGTARPYRMPADHPANRVGARVLAELYGREPYFVRLGGSIPVCELFQRHLGAYTLMFAFGLDDEQFHAPNEFFRLASFERAPAAYCRLLEEMAGADGAAMRMRS